MRYTEKMDCALIAMECIRLFEEMGYVHVTVFVDAEHGEVKIKIFGGRITKPLKNEIARFNRKKYWGVCYQVERRIFGGRIPIWNNKHWDVD